MNDKSNDAFTKQMMLNNLRQMNDSESIRYIKNFFEDSSPISNASDDLLREMKEKFDQMLITENSPIANFMFRKSNPHSNSKEEDMPMEYMWKGEGQINQKFYPLKSNIFKDDSAANTPENMNNYSTFTTYLENNPMQKYYDNKQTDGDTPKIDVSRLTKPEVFIHNSPSVPFRTNSNNNVNKMNNNNFENIMNEVKKPENYQSKFQDPQQQGGISNISSLNLNNAINHKFIPPTRNKSSKNQVSNLNNQSYGSNLDMSLNFSNINPYTPLKEETNYTPQGYGRTNNFNIGNNMNFYNNSPYTGNNEMLMNNSNFYNTSDYSNPYIQSFSNNKGYQGMSQMNQMHSQNQYKHPQITNLSQFNHHMLQLNNQNYGNYNNYNQMKAKINTHNGNFPNSSFNLQNMSINTISSKKSKNDLNDLNSRDFKTNKPQKPPLIHYLNMTNEELAVNSFYMSKDQAGCRYLQKKLEEEEEEFALKIYPYIVEHLIELMNDAFGNYLVQKLLDYLPNEKIFHIIAIINPHLSNLGVNPHGTRVVQKLISHLKSEELVSCFIKILKPHILILIKDMNGNHIIQKILNQVDIKFTSTIYDAIEDNSIEISTHKHGCCVLQKCIDSAKPNIKTKLIENLISNYLSIIVDQYGNYVIQYILSLNNLEYNRKLISGLMNNISYLSKQKYSSNVIEKCFDSSDEEMKSKLISSVKIPEIASDLIFDQFGNYVVQKALANSNDEERNEFLIIIAPLMEKLRFFNFGPKLYNKLIISYPQLSTLMFNEDLEKNRNNTITPQNYNSSNMNFGEPKNSMNNYIENSFDDLRYN